MADQQQVRLKVLLHQRHWQSYRTFCREYDRAAKTVDADLVGSWPSRPQLHRWLSGELKGLPYPDHCRVLEAMFPGWSAEQLFELCLSANGGQAGKVLSAVTAGFENPDSIRVEWGLPLESRLTAGNVLERTLPAPISTQALVEADAPSQEISRKIITLGQVLRLSSEEIEQLASLAGNFVDLELRIDIDIDRDRSSAVTYRYHILNLTTGPLARLQRDLWFEHSVGHLTISPINEGDRNVVIQPIHDAPNLAKFGVQMSPPIQPGETARVGYSCAGGTFPNNLYWRQDIARYTRHLTINLRHRGVGQLLGCSAVEEHPDGAENSAVECLTWDYDGEDVCITLTQDYLRPKQAVTLRWEI